MSALLRCPLYRKSTIKCVSQKFTCSCLFKHDEKIIREKFGQNIHIIDARLQLRHAYLYINFGINHKEEIGV